MTTRALQNIFESEFSWDNWRKVMDFVFPEFKFSSQPVAIERFKKSELEKIKGYFEHGNYTLDDNVILRLYEVSLTESVNLPKNVKQIRSFISESSIANTQATMAVFYSPDKSKWRFTLALKKLDGDFKEKDHRPESLTYVFGKGEKGRTAAERFFNLTGIKNKKLKDLEEAFSVEALSKKFFKEYKSIYEEFVKSIVNNPSRINLFRASSEELQKKAARDFVKKMMGRIIFLYFLQKKGWMGCKSKWKKGEDQFMRQLFDYAPKDDAFYIHFLEPLFFRTLNEKRKEIDEDCIINGKNYGKVPYLNGGLFEKDDNHPENLTLDWEIFRRFFELLDGYNFTIIEDDPDFKEIAVDPEMLGHIFENLLEDNKDKGAFYTPKEIVRYMCQESLIEYLHTEINRKIKHKDLKDTVEDFVKKQHFVGLNDISQHADKYILEALRRVKVCDPAIGSGAFPMGVLHEIFRMVEALGDRDVFHSIWELDEWNAAQVKGDIIQNSIYGIDIEKGAVDIARLRFWLSIIIDEETPKPLPNLDYKIVVGNSLLNKFEDHVINIEWEIKEGTQSITNTQEFIKRRSELLNEISEKQAEYFNADSSIRDELAIEIRDLKIDILINQFQLMIEQNGRKEEPRAHNFPKKPVFAKAYELYLKTKEWLKIIERLKSIKNDEGKFDHFDWNLDIPEVLNPLIKKENRGFDIVIGNPPYIQLQKMGKVADELQKGDYETFNRTGDIYCLFYELGNKILKEHGILTFITSNKWMRASYGKTLRSYFSNNCNPLKLIDLSGYKVFQNAIVETNILISEKTKNQDQIQTCLLTKDLTSLNYLSDFFRQRNRTTTNWRSEKAWVVMNDLEQSIKMKIEKIGTPLKNWEIRINYGIKTGFNDAFIIDSNTKNELLKKSPKSAEIIRPILKGRNIKQFQAEFGDLWLINSHNGSKRKKIDRINVQKDYPEVFNHLKKFEDKLIERQDKGDHWTNLRNCSYLDEFEKEKIIWLELTDLPKFAYDDKGTMIEATAFMMTGENLKFLVSFLNSKLCEWYFDKITTSSGVGTNRWKKVYIDELPIPKLSKKDMSWFELKVDEILKKKSLGESSKDIETQIDKALFELYGLTEEQIKLTLSQ